MLRPLWIDGTESLFVGGDGGIAVTSDLGVTYHSQFNRPLNNLQFYGGTLGGNIFINHGGTLTASSRYPGLLAGGTQDNGNVYRCPDTHRPGIPLCLTIHKDLMAIRHTQNILSDGAIPPESPELVRKWLAASSERVRVARIDLAKTYTNEFVEAANQAGLR